MSSLAVAALLTGSFGLTAIFATAQVASATTGDFTIPVGGSATISNAEFSACDPLAYGYQLSSNGSTSSPVQIDSKVFDCSSATTPAPIAGTTTIGPVTSPTTLAIYLTDSYAGLASPVTYYSYGNHALVSGMNPYTVDIDDSDEGSMISTMRSPTEGHGNITLTVTLIQPPLTGSPVTVGPATTNQLLTTPVATFVDPDNAATYNATISWGDSSPTSAGTITLASGTTTYTVTGTHTYSAHGTTASPVTVTITSSDGGSAVVTDNDVTVADAVITCSTTPCTGTLTSPTLTAQASTSSTSSGDLLLSGDPNSGSTALNCGDNFRHAPIILNESNTFKAGSGSITTTDTFLNKNGIPGKGLEGLLYAICFESNNPFVDASGKSVTLGLLQICNPFKPGPGPCVNWILPGAGGTIVEKVTYPAGDPKYG
jgi:hypothetical protein